MSPGAPSGRGAEGGGRWYLAAFAGAVAVHAAVLFGVRPGFYEPPEFAVVAGDSSLEVNLVAEIPAADPAEPPPEEPPEPPPPSPPPEPPIPTPPPEPSPPPEPAETPEVVVPIATATPVPTVPPRPRPAKPPQASSPPRSAKPSSRPASGPGATLAPNAAVASVRSGAASKVGYLRNPQPAYPEASRKAGHEGVVLLRVSVSESGAVTTVRVVKSSGYGALDERALSTVRQRWKFKPARQNGQPVTATVEVPIRFSLKR